MQQERAHVSFPIGPGSDPKQIGNVGVGGARSPVEGFSDGAQANIRRDDGNSAGDRGAVHAITRKRPDSRRTPQRCGGIQPGDVQPVSQDYAGSQEADARDNLPRDAKTIVRTCCKCREHDKHRCTGGDEGVRAKTGHALPPLAFGADEGPEDQSQSQANCKVMPKHVSSFPADHTDRTSGPGSGLPTAKHTKALTRERFLVVCYRVRLSEELKRPTRSGFVCPTKSEGE